MFRTKGLNCELQFHGFVAVCGIELVVLQLDDIAALFGHDGSHFHEAARLVRKQDAHSKNAVAHDQSVLHHGSHRDHIHVAAGQHAYDLLFRNIHVLQSRHGQKA